MLVLFWQLLKILATFSQKKEGGGRGGIREGVFIGTNLAFAKGDYLTVSLYRIITSISIYYNHNVKEQAL